MSDQRHPLLAGKHFEDREAAEGGTPVFLAAFITFVLGRGGRRGGVERHVHVRERGGIGRVGGIVLLALDEPGADALAAEENEPPVRAQGLALARLVTRCALSCPDHDIAVHDADRDGSLVRLADLYAPGDAGHRRRGGHRLAGTQTFNPVQQLRGYRHAGRREAVAKSFEVSERRELRLGHPGDDRTTRSPTRASGPDRHPTCKRRGGVGGRGTVVRGVQSWWPPPIYRLPGGPGAWQSRVMVVADRKNDFVFGWVFARHEGKVEVVLAVLVPASEGS